MMTHLCRWVCFGIDLLGVPTAGSGRFHVGGAVVEERDSFWLDEEEGFKGTIEMLVGLFQLQFMGGDMGIEAGDVRESAGM